MRRKIDRLSPASAFNQFSHLFGWMNWRIIHNEVKSSHLIMLVQSSFQKLHVMTGSSVFWLFLSRDSFNTFFLSPWTFLISGGCFGIRTLKLITPTDETVPITVGDSALVVGVVTTAICHLGAQALLDLMLILKLASSVNTQFFEKSISKSFQVVTQS